MRIGNFIVVKHRHHGHRYRCSACVWKYCKNWHFKSCDGIDANHQWLMPSDQPFIHRPCQHTGSKGNAKGGTEENLTLQEARSVHMFTAYVATKHNGEGRQSDESGYSQPRGDSHRTKSAQCWNHQCEKLNEGMPRSPHAPVLFFTPCNEDWSHHNGGKFTGNCTCNAQCNRHCSQYPCSDLDENDYCTAHNP